MKIAFVYTNIATIGWNSFNKFGPQNDDCFVIPPGITYLKALLDEDGRHESDIIDFRMLSGPDEYRQRLSEGNYDIVGISSLSPGRDFAVLAARIAKEQGPITLAGGVHASALPEDFVSTGYFDCVVVGEAERTLFEILALMERGEKLPPIYRTSNYVKDLNELPFPSRAYLPTYAHAFDINGRMAGITGTRGCPGRCKYCWPNQRIMYGSTYIRRRTPENIVQEITYLQATFAVKFIAFYDDTFSWNKPWLREFRDYIKDMRDNGVHLPPIGVNARANTFDEEVAEILKEIDCIGVWFGFESGSPKILKLIQKGCTLEQNVRAAKICREAGFDVNANMLVGIPGETEEDYILSYKFLETIQPDNVRYNILTPYPGSTFYEELAPKGLIEMNDYEDLEVNRPYHAGKGVIKSVDYELVMRWVEPFRSFQERAQLKRRLRLLQDWRGVPFPWLFAFLEKNVDSSPLAFKAISRVFHFLAKIYHRFFA